MSRAALISACPSAPTLGSWRSRHSAKSTVWRAFSSSERAAHRAATLAVHHQPRAQSASRGNARSQSALAGMAGDFSWSGRSARGMRSASRSWLSSARNGNAAGSGGGRLCAVRGGGSNASASARSSLPIESCATLVRCSCSSLRCWTRSHEEGWA